MITLCFFLYLEMSIYDIVGDLNIENWSLERDNENIDGYIEGLVNIVKNHTKKSQAKIKGKNGGKTGKDSNAKVGSLLRLLSYYKILLYGRNFITPYFEHLNLLWRDMNFIRVRLLTDGIISTEKIPYQLDFGRMEASYLKVQDDPEIKTCLDNAAEDIDNSITSNPSNNKRAIRSLISLLGRLNNLRISRINDQFQKKKMYMRLLVILIVLSFFMFYLDDVLLKIKVTVNTYPMLTTTASNIFESSYILAANWMRKLANIVIHNPMMFIFFSGLLGGFFSALMKFKPAESLPGDEAYIRWYVLTKPFIGAFGATILFVIISSKILSTDLININKILAQELISNPVGSEGFTFGFLTGFSERIILPKLK